MSLSRVIWASVLAAPWCVAQPGTPVVPCEASLSEELARAGREALRSGRSVAATRDLREAYDVCPSSRGLLLELARALTAERKFADAIDTAQQFLTTEPESAAGLLVLANALFMAQRWEECAPILDRTLKLEPENATALLLKANNLYLLGNTEGAEQAFLTVLDRNPSDVDAAYMLGRIYYMTNRAGHAAGQFQRVLRLDPGHYKAWDNLGLCYSAQGDPERAIRHFLKAISLVQTAHPEYDWPYGNLSDVLRKQNRFEEAYSAAHEAAKRNPKSSRNFYLGGQALVQLARYAEAAKWLEQAVVLDGNSTEALYALAQVYTRMGDKVKAAEILNRFRTARANAPKERR
jgi:tetratricopeptide (TPR) repeat protein